MAKGPNRNIRDSPVCLTASGDFLGGDQLKPLPSMEMLDDLVPNFLG
jgi:hypothetical protein